MTSLLPLSRFSPSHDSPKKSPLSQRRERKAFQLPMLRKLYADRVTKNKAEQKGPSFNSLVSKELSSSDFAVPPLEVAPFGTGETQPKPRPGMTRARSSSLRLLLKKPSSRLVNDAEGFRTTMPRRRSSVRIAKHMGSSRKLLCRMTSQHELIVNPHQAEGAEDVSYYQLEIGPVTTSTSFNDPSNDDNSEDEDGPQQNHRQQTDKINGNDCNNGTDDNEGDSDDLSTASDPMCYLPVRAQKQREETDDMKDFEKNHKSLSAFSMLALFLNSNNHSSESRRSRHRDALTHC